MDVSWINCEETIGKTVGRRTRISDPVRYGLRLQSSMKSFPCPRIPKGLYKFSTHEEADEWMMKHLIQSAKS